MATDDPLLRLQILQRDLIAFSESRLPNVERLAIQLDASAEDFKRLLDRNRKNESSRAIVAPREQPWPKLLTLDEVEYNVQDQFRQDALVVADELDLDELEAAKLCIRAPPPDASIEDTTLPYRALLRFHERRHALLDCLRLLLQLSLDPESGDDRAAAFRVVINELMQGERSNQSAYWRKCLDGLSDVEEFLKKIGDHRQTIIMTGQTLTGTMVDALIAQRVLLTRQHECLSAVLSHLIHGNYIQPEDFRGFLSKAATLSTEIDITIHYLPVLASGAVHFGSDQITSPDVAHDLHRLFASGPGQLQWKQANFKAAATILWLSEYSSRYANLLGDGSSNESERIKAGDREALFLDSLKANGLHFMLAAATFLRPVVWYDPARVGIIDFLLDYTPAVPSDSPIASEEFAALTMREFQTFTDAFVFNMPDTLRKLKFDEDELRRAYLSQNGNGTHHFEMNLERFMVIMACAYQGDAEAALEFWSSRENHLYGFLRWASQRLPTPRVAAFCQLLQSIAGDEKSANHAHRFLLEDAGMPSGKLRKGYSVSWAQIFSELEIYTSSLKDRPMAAPTAFAQDNQIADINLEEPETGIMLESYLGLAAHVCRMSPDARNWLLKDQQFHLGEVMFQLARSASIPRVGACCLDMLSALLTDTILEVRNGSWALLDSWISSGSDVLNPPAPQGRQRYSAKQYLQPFANHAEAGIAMIELLNALIVPLSKAPDCSLDALPFPEQLGATSRNSGINVYVDFVLDTVLAHKIPRMVSDGEASLIDLLYYQCLEFVYICLSSFNENLVLLANTSNVGVESTMENKSLAVYMRLHPFARVMEWLLTKSVANSLFTCLRQGADAVNSAETNSPLVQSILKCVQVINLAWKLQPTWFNIVKRETSNQPSRTQPVPSSTATSVDELFWSHLDVVDSIASFITTRHVDLSLECLALLRKIGSSRKLAAASPSDVKHVRPGNRIVGLISHASSSLTLELQQDFVIEDWDLETEGQPLKLVKAQAILDLLNSSLIAANGKPCIAHAILGFDCHERTLSVLPYSSFARGTSLFHAIATCAVTLPVVQDTSHVSWLLAVRRGCFEVIAKLAGSPLTANLVRPELRSMEFLAAVCQGQAPIAAASLWDWKSNLDPNLLLENSSSQAISDFMHVRQLYFQFCAMDLRAAVEQGAYSVQEKIMSVLLGSAILSTGEQIPVKSVYELFDFFDLETVGAWEASCKFLAGADYSACTRDDPETGTAYDVGMVHELLMISKRELVTKGTIKDDSETQQVDDEIRAVLASLTSQNHWTAIQNARLGALEAWTDLLSLMATQGGLAHDQGIALSLQGLLIILPKFEKSVQDNLDAAAQLAKLTLTFTHAVCPALKDPSQQTAGVAVERLVAAVRVALKVVTDSSADLALRDVCYRIGAAVLESILSATARTSSGAKQLLQLAQNAGERLLTVVTEDVFSGRGITRVSALLFLDGLVALFQLLKVSGAMLRSLTKLNFVPVLIDTSVISTVSQTFPNDDDAAAADEQVTSLAFFHTAFALVLRLCQTADGAQLVLDAGFVATVDDSKLFSVDPDLGLDIDNPAALSAFYAILAQVVRVLTALVVAKGPQVARDFLRAHRVMVQAIFKHTSSRRGAGRDGEEAVEIQSVADGLTRLILATGFLEDDEAASGSTVNGFT